MGRKIRLPKPFQLSLLNEAEIVLRKKFHPQGALLFFAASKAEDSKKRKVRGVREKAKI